MNFEELMTSIGKVDDVENALTTLIIDCASKDVFGLNAVAEIDGYEIEVSFEITDIKKIKGSENESKAEIQRKKDLIRRLFL